MTRILKKIPYHFSLKIGRSLFVIDTEFDDFIQVSFAFHGKTWHGFWTSSSHGISMTCTKKMMGFPSNLVSFSNQTAIKKTWENPCHVFYRVVQFLLKNKKLPWKKCDRDFLMSHWPQFGRKLYQIRWKSHHILSKCRGNSMTWTCPKSMSCFCNMENK